MKTIRFKNELIDEECYVIPGTYGNNRLALRLVGVTIDHYGMNPPIATATVNIPHAELPPNCVFIKDWSENKGMVECLIDANIINPVPQGRVTTGFVVAGAYELTAEMIEYIKNYKRSHDI